MSATDPNELNGCAQYCPNTCCRILVTSTVTPHTPQHFSPRDYTIKQRTVKAGIVARHHYRVLIVQSYGHKWGFPKGSMEPIDGGSLEQCARREFTEETCIALPVDTLLQYAFRHDRTTYYTMTFTEPPDVALPPGDEITGIAWIGIGCLRELVDAHAFPANAHLRRWLDGQHDGLNGASN